MDKNKADLQRDIGDRAVIGQDEDLLETELDLTPPVVHASKNNVKMRSYQSVIQLWRNPL